ncbi:MAG: hypothetical protein JJE34_09690 [Alphaproteobacteria bacterium]|nr:hypothetical protein [Alphaproteobacteria bacterium]
MRNISTFTPDQLQLSKIDEVVFYKRDEITTDLICCDVSIGGKVWFFHEEATGWDTLIDHLGKLPGWRSDWFSSVSQPPFAECRTIAFQK